VPVCCQLVVRHYPSESDVVLATPAPNHFAFVQAECRRCFVADASHRGFCLEISPSITLAPIVPAPLTNGECHRLHPTVAVSTIGATSTVIRSRIGPGHIPTGIFIAIPVQSHSDLSSRSHTWQTTGC